MVKLVAYMKIFAKREYTTSITTVPEGESSPAYTIWCQELTSVDTVHSISPRKKPNYQPCLDDMQTVTLAEIRRDYGIQTES